MVKPHPAKHEGNTQGLALGAWLTSLGLDLVMFLDMVTRFDPSWRVEPSRFVLTTLAVVAACGLFEALFVWQPATTQRAARWGWSLAHIMASVLVMLGVGQCVEVAVSADAWHVPSKQMLAGLDWFMIYAGSALRAGIARMPVQFSYRKLLHSKPRDAKRRLLRAALWSTLCLGILVFVDVQGMDFAGRANDLRGVFGFEAERRVGVWRSAFWWLWTLSSLCGVVYLLQDARRQPGAA